MDIKFTDEEMELLKEAGYVQTYDAGSMIYLEGDTANTLFFIREGRVRVIINQEDGNELTLEIVEKGRVFGESSFLSKSARPTTVTAVNQVELICCSIDTLMPCLCNYPQLLLKLLQHCSETMNHLSYMLHSFRFMDRYQKVASFLLTETMHDNKDKNITENALPYSHEEIAWCLGLTRPTVSRVLKDLEKEGLVDCGYGIVYIKDRSALHKLIRMKGRNKSTRFSD